MVSIENEAAKVQLITCLADALQKSIIVKQDEAWSCAASTTKNGPVRMANQDALLMQIRLRGTLHGQLGIEIARAAAKSLLDLKGSESEIDAWQLVLAGVIQRLPKRAVDAGMFAFSVESFEVTDLSVDHAQIGKMELSREDGTRGVLRVLADDELTESLRIAEWSVEQSATNDIGHQTVSSELERVIDVPLTVSLRFGQRTMRLREVLELNTGALVELDRQVEDPVDLILDDQVIARGEVVIVDGNYGLRVTQILQRPSAFI